MSEYCERCVHTDKECASLRAEVEGLKRKPKCEKCGDTGKIYGHEVRKHRHGFVNAPGRYYPCPNCQALNQKEGESA